MMDGDLFVGIDVAFAKKKRLPMCVLRSGANNLEIVPMRKCFRPPPAGKGNAAALDDDIRIHYAAEVRAWLTDLEQEIGGKIRRIAIDAPRCFCSKKQARRAAERKMDELKISVFTTPTKAQFDEIKGRARDHLASGGAESRIPHANQIWMLIGFELFKVLDPQFECIEVYPQATVRILDAGHYRKSSHAGHRSQIIVLSDRLNTSYDELSKQVPQVGYGSKHDKLDALMSAWVASLGAHERIPLGDPPNDVIWIPRTRSLAQLCNRN
jgi:hypothetical protein